MSDVLGHKLSLHQIIKTTSQVHKSRSHISIGYVPRQDVHYYIRKVRICVEHPLENIFVRATRVLRVAVSWLISSTFTNAQKSKWIILAHYIGKEFVEQYEEIRVEKEKEAMF